ncbi:hypothetical protein JCM8547_004853 [Rhodosporidiobolus lusitaniae]
MEVDQQPPAQPQQPPAAPVAPPLTPGTLSRIEEEGDGKQQQPAPIQLPGRPAPAPTASALPAQAPAVASTSGETPRKMDDSEANAAAATLAGVAASAASAAAAAAAPAPAPATATPPTGERPPGSFDPAAPNAVNGLPNPLPANYDKTQPICANCATQTTPLWRRSHDSTHILCNACALFFKMKGRPRPISLKTDVIKSRNRSKGKSTSKDRGGKSAVANSSAAALASPAARGTSKERGESMTRSGDGRKSGPGGAGADDDQDMADGRTKPFGEGALDGGDARKARKVMPTGPMPPYGMPYPGYPYPYPYPHGPHPHGHQPYPPPRSRSRSSDPTRRGQSIDARQRGVGGSASPATEGTPVPVPGAPPIPHLPYGYPGFIPGQPLPEGYPGYPPFYPYGPPPAGFNPGQPPPYYPAPFAHPAAALAHAASLHPPAAITHAQSDSRSHSPAAESRPSSTRGSQSPPHSSAPPALAAPPAPQSWYPHPNPNYHLHQPHTHSPLAGPRPAVSRNGSGSPATVPKPPAAEDDPNGRVTLAPIVGGTSNSGSDAETVRATSEEKAIHLPSIAAVSAGPPAFPTLASATTVSRHTSLFDSRASVGSAAVPPPTATRERGASISSASPSASGSSEGLRSPETTSRALAPSWASLGGASLGGTPSDERRGRPEKRFDDYGLAASTSGKGKGREAAMDNVDEVDELDDDLAPPGEGGSSSGGSHSRARMNGVEAGLGELRVSSQLLQAQRTLGSPAPATGAVGSGAHRLAGSSRSRSRVRGENERGRSRGVLGGPSVRTNSASGTSRVRGSSSASSSAGGGVRGREGTAGLAVPGREHWPADAHAEMARLKTKISELTFLNGLMQSRLAQLEGPGRVPRNVMTSLTAETPRPDPDEMLFHGDEEDEEMGRPEPIEEEAPTGYE